MFSWRPRPYRPAELRRTSRAAPCGFLPDWFDSLDRVLSHGPGEIDPRPSLCGRLGSKDDVRNLKRQMTGLPNTATIIEVAAALGSPRPSVLAFRPRQDGASDL